MKKSVLILLVLLLSLPLLGARKTKVAVMELEDQSKTLDEALLKNATEYLRSKLVSTGLFVVIDQTRQQKKIKTLIKKNKKESYKACYDKSCQIPLGQALAADTILRSTITQFAGVYSISTELVDLSKEATVAGTVIDFDGTPKGMRTAISNLIKELVQKQKASKGEKPKRKKPKIKIYSVEFNSRAENASVNMDGEPLCKEVPCLREVIAGKHVFRMNADGYKTKKRTININGNKVFQWNLKPVPKPEKKIVKKEQKIEKVDKKPQKISKKVPTVTSKVETIRPYKWYAVGSLGVAVLSAGAGILFDQMIASSMEERDKLESSGQYEEAIGYDDDAKMFGTLRMVSYIGAGVFAVGGAVLFFITEDVKTAQTFQFHIDDQSVYLGLNLQF